MSANRVLEIVRCVATSGGPVTPTRISERIGVPRASVYRMVSMLEAEDVLARSPDRTTVQLSSGFLRTIIAGAGADQAIAGFEDAMTCAANQWGATAFLGRLNGSAVEVVHSVTPCDTRGGFVHPGNSIRPAHACSASRAILAYLAPDLAAAIIGDNRAAFTEHTITEPEALRRELAATRDRGYAICDEEIEPGITSVAAPVIIGRAGVVYSLGIVSFARRIREQGLATVGAHLGEMAARAALNASQNLFEGRYLAQEPSRI